MRVARWISYGFGIFALLWLLPLLSEGQDGSKVTIQGVVVEADSLSPLPYVHIRGQGGQTGAATDALGKFGVNVHNQDTIMFTSVGYQPYFLVPADSTSESLQHLVIRMTPQVEELQEITIRAYDNIEQYIRREPEPFSMYRKKGEPLFERKEPREPAKIGTAGGMNGARLEGGVTALANLFNNQYQQEKKLKKILAAKEAEAQQEQLRKVMTEKYQEMLVYAAELSEVDIERFISTHMPPPQAMIHMDDYTIMLGIVQSLRTFKTEAERQSEIRKLLKTKVFEGEGAAVNQ